MSKFEQINGELFMWAGHYDMVTWAGHYDMVTMPSKHLYGAAVDLVAAQAPVTGRTYNPLGATAAAPVPQPPKLSYDDVVAQAHELGATYKEIVDSSYGYDIARFEVVAHNGAVYRPASVEASDTALVEVRRGLALRWLELHNDVNPYVQRPRGGINDAPRRPCARKPDTHGFHPNNEKCPYCP